MEPVAAGDNSTDLAAISPTLDNCPRNSGPTLDDNQDIPTNRLSFLSADTVVDETGQEIELVA
jgi:hypothetical protein